MKPITLLLAAGSLLLSAQGLSAQTDGSGKKEYWNAKLLQKSEMRKDIVIELSYKGFG